MVQTSADYAYTTYDFASGGSRGTGTDVGYQMELNESTGEVYVAGIATVTNTGGLGNTRKAFVKKYSSNLVDSGYSLLVADPLKPRRKSANGESDGSADPWRLPLLCGDHLV